MGYIINPVSNRLGLNTFWHSNWSLNNSFNYTRLHKQNLFLFSFLNWALKSNVFTKRFVRFTHYSIHKTSKNNIYVNVYFYWPKFLSAGKSPWQVLPFFPRGRFSRKQIFRFRKIYRKVYRHYTRLLIPQFYWFCLKSVMNKYLLNATRLNFRFYKVGFDNVTPQVVSTYIVHRLIQRQSLRFILRPILRDLSIRLKQQKIQGYKILCAGRFTRRQIAERNWYKQGAISNNNFSNVIAYTQTKVRLKYGTCGIKVWLNFGNPKRGSSQQGFKLQYPLSKIMENKINMQNIFFKQSSWAFVLFQWQIKGLNAQEYYHYLHYRLKRTLNKSYKRQLNRELTLIHQVLPRTLNIKPLKVINHHLSFDLISSQTDLILHHKVEPLMLSNKKYFYYE